MSSVLLNKDTMLSHLEFNGESWKLINMEPIKKAENIIIEGYSTFGTAERGAVLKLFQMYAKKLPGRETKKFIIK